MSASTLTLPTAEPTRFPAWVTAASVASVLVAGAVGFATGSVSVAVVVILSVSAVVVGWLDVSWRRIPNVMCAALVCFASATAWFVEVPVGSVVVGLLATSLPFALLHALNPSWVGFGDVKLLAGVGATLGLLSPYAGLMALWLAGVGAVVTRPWVPAGWRRSVPFGFWLSVMAVPVAVGVGVTT